MEFFNLEDNEENPQNYSLNFSYDDEIESNFINDSEEITKGISFSRSLDHNNGEQYNKFPIQTRNPITVICDDKNMYFGEDDTQPD